MVLGYVNSSQNAVSHELEFGKLVDATCAKLQVIFREVDVVTPVMSKFFIFFKKYVRKASHLRGAIHVSLTMYHRYDDAGVVFSTVVANLESGARFRLFHGLPLRKVFRESCWVLFIAAGELPLNWKAIRLGR